MYLLCIYVFHRCAALRKTYSNRIGIPIIEYKQDDEKMGCFERVISLLDALNEATSNRLNGLAQFVQSILWMNNCEIDSEQMEQLKDKLWLLKKGDKTYGRLSKLFTVKSIVTIL